MNHTLTKSFRTFINAFTVAVLLLTVSCTKEDFVGQRPKDDGATLTVSQAVDPSNFGRTIRVDGTVSAVCQEEGCWMTVTDGSSHLRMTFKDESFYVPLELEGHVIVEGIVREEVFDEESARAIGETVGMTPDQIEYIEGDQRIPIMVATGVLFVSK